MTGTQLTRQKVLVVTPDVLGTKMAGPAIRAFEIAKALHAVADVRLVSTEGSALADQGFPVEHASDYRLRQLIPQSDVLVLQGHILSSHPWIVNSDIIIVADLYDPMQLEILEHGKDFEPFERVEHTRSTVDALNMQIERADYMICASEKQRDLWLGHLGALCRINPLTYDADQSLRSLIDVVPFGVQDEPARQTVRGIKDGARGIHEQDAVLLWGGGIYNWFDPLTLIRAVAELAPRRPQLKLFFLGVQHPNPNVPEMQMVADAQALSSELGLTDQHVFFNETWVPYDERANYLLDADLGVSTHFDHVETAFSFRTRILDYLWAGLPVVSTAGDTFAQVIAENDLGAVVPPENSSALAEAIEQTLFDVPTFERQKANVELFRESLVWSRALEPLLKFCTDPKHAADYKRGLITPREAHRREVLSRLAEIENSTVWRASTLLRSTAGKLKSAVRRTRE